MTPGLTPRTVVYATGLAVVVAALLSSCRRCEPPACACSRASRTWAAGATLRFGRVWTGAMIVQVALTAIGIPIAMEGANQTIRKLSLRAGFASQEYLVAGIDVERPFDDEATPAGEAGRARTLAALERRLALEPGVVAVTFADRAPGSGGQDRAAQRRVVPATGRPSTVRSGRRRWGRASSKRSIARWSPAVPSRRPIEALALAPSSSTRRRPRLRARDGPRPASRRAPPLCGAFRCV